MGKKESLSVVEFTLAELVALDYLLKDSPVYGCHYGDAMSGIVKLRLAKEKANELQGQVNQLVPVKLSGRIKGCG